MGEIIMAYSERELLARIIQCEAGGEGDNGMKAVASVIMNRTNSSEGEYSRISQGREHKKYNPSKWTVRLCYRQFIWKI